MSEVIRHPPLDFDQTLDDYRKVCLQNLAVDIINPVFLAKFRSVASISIPNFEEIWKGEVRVRSESAGWQTIKSTSHFDA
ncbi:hypothetical protein A2697_00975 [Candidatus Curtissbacteria bacterium RIFCSPHIGHO2_01_FULL_41_44]|uniref:Uncharacterized protein n=1 Tax=Candidatus Curtissbacteria bacterium RIFCSPLOWO2_01_FULL_42_50 TaxID=1797730 RepID=A0A1F5H2R5_9BACT|nr:MAG: hypothetical protein A3C33_02275 [Candidatus Curtissbacteria bacterium RIFCSPHIGHO2_02_FULL_42_58]OGD94823.1 MAG: hypothetical protein A2697_00975 [Candidatus Curtissbacteria bacterium RIFCSPHIGHO2_01_FULL_41_44]OGD96424.1 MAG: hypothetical protein A3E71_02415 [Candidatus Curtissbacteria bacterium RIFCSPHIGHO2_12_FULL_42_33]OGD98450.1 MAG: hypothetical protein A3B54_04255 [Candidatus Curtissbacteria bacterium RIFCSPLOWO2_01_FULL_42_50]OGE02680.1 MAG: hypothetical protein A3G16_01740 [Ca